MTPVCYECGVKRSPNWRELSIRTAPHLLCIYEKFCAQFVNFLKAKKKEEKKRSEFTAVAATQSVKSDQKEEDQYCTSTVRS